VGVGTGQDFDVDMKGTASTADDLSDRMRIDFLQDNGNGVIDAGESFNVNRFTFVMNQNNSPGDDGDLVVRAYNGSTELQITGILINGSTLVGAGGAPVAGNDGTTVTATARGKGYELNGLGGGTGGSTTDNDTVTIITDAPGYNRIDIKAAGLDANKDTFDILLQSIALPSSFDITFKAQAQLSDFDGDKSAAADLNVTLDADGVFAALLLPQPEST
jgi:hypothetical protein